MDCNSSSGNTSRHTGMKKLLELHEPSGNTCFFVAAWIEQVADTLSHSQIMPTSGCRIWVGGHEFPVNESKAEVVDMLERALQST